jgi:transposase
MQESSSSVPAEGVAAYVGIDWADQKHDVILRAASEPAKVEYRRIAHKPDALMEWLGELQQRFAGKGKILVCLEQSRGALIYHLMNYEFLELYPINPSQVASFRKTFSPGGAKDDRPDAELICELLYYHRDRLKAWKPDDELTRKLAFLNEGRRKAVDQRTELANEIKSQLKVYFPLALPTLDNDTRTALAADLLLQWPTLDLL